KRAKHFFDLIEKQPKAKIESRSTTTTVTAPARKASDLASSLPPLCLGLSQTTDSVCSSSYSTGQCWCPGSRVSILPELPELSSPDVKPSTSGQSNRKQPSTAVTA